MDIRQRVEQILTILFRKEIQDLDNFSMESEPLWDSMKHIEVIMTLEEELGISFPPEQIPLLTSAPEIIARVKELGA